MRRLAPIAALASALALLGCPPAHAAAGWSWPLRGEVINPYRNGGDPYAAGQHRGIDIAGRLGEPVVAATGGSVRFAGTAGRSGLTVSVRTANGRYDTSYLHLSAIHVRAGERVAAGDRIGAVGTSGRRSATAPHLHFGIRDAGSRHAYHDPLRFLPPAPPRPREPGVPRGTPAPIGAPTRPAPAPRPVEAPSGRRLPLPAGRRHPAPVPAPSRISHGAPAPLPRARIGLEPVPAGHPARGGEPAHRPVRAPAAGPASRLDPAPGVRLGPGGARAAGGAPDLGWALACAGLLLAAAFVGGAGDGGAAAGRVRARAAALLRPLAGRG